MNRLLRLCLVLLVTVSVLAPKVSAVAAGLLPAGDRVVVICTGRGLERIVLDADGIPVPDAAQPDHCALVHAADTAAPLPAATPGQRLRPLPPLRVEADLPLPPRGPQRPAPRAPPVA